MRTGFMWLRITVIWFHKRRWNFLAGWATVFSQSLLHQCCSGMGHAWRHSPSSRPGPQVGASSPPPAPGTWLDQSKKVVNLWWHRTHLCVVLLVSEMRSTHTEGARPVGPSTTPATVYQQHVQHPTAHASSWKVFSSRTGHWHFKERISVLQNVTNRETFNYTCQSIWLSVSIFSICVLTNLRHSDVLLHLFVVCLITLSVVQAIRRNEWMISEWTGKDMEGNNRGTV
jgi:hypothetical protein